LGRRLAAFALIWPVLAATTATPASSAPTPPPAACPAADPRNGLPAGISYIVPTGYQDGSTGAESYVDLAASSRTGALEDIRFLPVTPVDVTGATATAVGGFPAFVVVNVARSGLNGTYERVVVL